MTDATLEWISVGRIEDLPEGRVKTVTARTTSICLVHFDGQWAAMNNHCPHQKGPLGEGSIEKGVDDKCWIRCPWHGWDFDPLTGKPPGGHEDSGQDMYPLEVRDGEIFVGLEAEPPHERTVTDVMVETMTNWGVQTVFGMVGHSNLGLADAIRRKTIDKDLKYYGIRHEGVDRILLIADPLIRLGNLHHLQPLKPGTTLSSGDAGSGRAETRPVCGWNSGGYMCACHEYCNGARRSLPYRSCRVSLSADMGHDSLLETSSPDTRSTDAAQG